MSPAYLRATAGSLVTYNAHPEWGEGVVRRIEPNDRLLVDFEIDGEPYSDDFHYAELKTSHRARPLITRTA
jgi:hypothetical protein